MILKLSWRNIWRNKRRTILTLSSIAFAVLLSCVMRSMQLGSYERMIGNALSFYSGHIQVHKNGYWQNRTIDLAFRNSDALQSWLSEHENVINVIPRLESFALASFKLQTKGAMVLGIDPERENLLTGLQKKLVQGEYLGLDDNAIILAAGLAKYLKIGVNDSLVLIGQGYHGANAAGIFRVKGIVKFPIAEQNNRMIYLPLKKAQFLYAADNMVTNYTLQITNINDAEALAEELSTGLKGREMEANGWKFMMPELIQTIELDNISGKIMLGILYMVIGFGMFGTFLMMTRERMYELGLMMAVGIRKTRIQAMIFLEFLYLSLLGVLFGVLLSLPVLVYFYFNPIKLGTENADIFEKFGIEPIYAFSLDLSIFYNQAWIIFFMTIFLGCYPLWVVFRLNIIKALRP